MFAGAGDFFRPVDLRKEVSPAAAVKPVSSGGEDRHKYKSGTSQEDESAEDAAEGGGAAQAFSDDAISLSLPALFMMLTGVPPAPAQAEDQDRSPALARGALGAYLRAAETLPAAPPAVPVAAPVAGAGAEIFQMLAALEKAGVTALTVCGGQTIYEALRLKCRAHDIALAAPSASPDNGPQG